MLYLNEKENYRNQWIVTASSNSENDFVRIALFLAFTILSTPPRPIEFEGVTHVGYTVGASVEKNESRRWLR